MLCIQKECRILKFPGILNLQNCLSLCTKSSIAPNSSVPFIFSYSIFMPKEKAKDNTTTTKHEHATHNLLDIPLTKTNMLLLENSLLKNSALEIGMI